MALQPYPSIYCPPGQAPPACCPHLGGMQLAVPGPDGLMGMLYGAGGFEVGDWRKTAAGWWVRLCGHLPQHLARLQAHPRVPRWAVVEGAEEDHWWRVPILLSHQGKTFGSALDRLWDGGQWAPPADLEPLQRQVLAIVGHVPLADTPEERPADAAAMYALVEGLLEEPEDARARLALVVRDLVRTNPERPPPFFVAPERPGRASVSP
jgi:hypothetical protein